MAVGVATWYELHYRSIGTIKSFVGTVLGKNEFLVQL